MSQKINTKDKYINILQGVPKKRPLVFEGLQLWFGSSYCVKLGQFWNPLVMI